MLTVYEFRRSPSDTPKLVVKYHNAIFTVGKQATKDATVLDSSTGDSFAHLERLTHELKAARLETINLHKETMLKTENERQRLKEVIQAAISQERAAMDARLAQLEMTLLAQVDAGSDDSPIMTQVPPPSSISRASSALFGTGNGPSSANGDIWTITPERRAQYDSFFMRVDASGTGFVQGDQARVVFSKSNLPMSTLAAIWSLVTVRKEKALSKGEFAMAMHLITLCREGNALPDVLPKSLLATSGLGAGEY
jgi:hypothetical protein